MPQGCRPAGAENARRDSLGTIPHRRTAVLLLGHGSRVAAANAAFEALVAAFRLRHPELPISHAYVELAAPLLADALHALAAGADRVVVLPLFLLTAGHLKDDLPAALEAARAAHPQVRFEAARALGVASELVELAVERAGEAVRWGGGGRGAATAGEVAVLAVGRGSSDADANGDFCKLVRLVGERGGFARAEPCFIAVTGPRAPAALEALARAHAGPIAVWPFFLFEGLLHRQLDRELREFRARHPGRHVALAGPLAPDERLLRVLERRLAEALDAPAGARCEACPRAVA